MPILIIRILPLLLLIPLFASSQSIIIGDISFDHQFTRVADLEEDESESYEVPELEDRTRFISGGYKSDIIDDIYMFAGAHPQFVDVAKMDSSTILVNIHIDQISFFLDNYGKRNDSPRLEWELEYVDIKGNTIGQKETMSSQFSFSELMNSYESTLEEEFMEWFRYDLGWPQDFTTYDNQLYGLALGVVDAALENSKDGSSISQETMNIDLSGEALVASFEDRKAISIPVRGEGRYINGTLLGGEYILTDARVFLKSDEVYAYVTEEDSIKIDPVRLDLASNLGLGKMSNTQLQPVVALKQGDMTGDLTSIGTTGSFRYEDVLIKLNVTQSFTHLGVETKLVDGAAHVSYSGSPIYNDKNELIGVIVATDYDDSYNLVFTALDKASIEKSLNIKL